MISEETEKIAEQLVGFQGRFFSRDYQYYITGIKRQFSDPNMKLLYIVQYKRNKNSNKFVKLSIDRTERE